jgi:hypothetical protein
MTVFAEPRNSLGSRCNPERGTGKDARHHHRRTGALGSEVLCNPVAQVSSWNLSDKDHKEYAEGMKTGFGTHVQLRFTESSGPRRRNLAPE